MQNDQGSAVDRLVHHQPDFERSNVGVKRSRYFLDLGQSEVRDDVFGAVPVGPFVLDD